MNQKHLVFVLSAMTISFTLILGVMMVFTETNSRPSPPRDQKVSLRNKRDLDRPLYSNHTPNSMDRSTESKSENKPDSEQNDTPPNRKSSQATLDEFSSLRNELRQQIGTLQRDRSAMIADLAKILSTLRPDQIADELSTFDEKTIHFILSQYDPDHQKAIQLEMTSRNEK